MAKRAKRVLVLPDAHYPHQDPVCEAIVIKAAELLRPDETVILGDWADCEAASMHPPSTLEELGPLSLTGEYSLVNAAIDRLHRAAGGCKWAYVEGNHEHRVERWATKMGGALGADFHRVLSPRHCIADGRSGFTWIPYAQAQLSHYEIAPDLWAIHGWSYSKHAAAKHSEKAVDVSVVHGHTHRQQSYARRIPSSGRVVKAWSPGCLAKLQPIYAHKNGPTEWVQGFSIVYVGSRDWTEYTITIKPEGHCVLPDGKQVRV